MRLFITFVGMYAKKYIRIKSIIICLLLLILASIILIIGQKEDNSEGIVVGVLVENEDKITDSIIDNLLNNKYINFKVMDSEDELYNAITK